MSSQPSSHGLMVEFLTADELLAATRAAWQAGYRDMDAYAPYPVEGLAEALGMRRSKIPSLVLLAALVGTAVGFGMQYFATSVDYPSNVAGRPLNSWPVYIPITFEVLVLVASFAAAFGMFLLNGMPRPHHPVFNVPQFQRASQDRFFLCIETRDPLFDGQRVEQFLSGLHPHGEVVDVPRD